MSILNIIDEQENIIGEETRENIHKRGLLHREIHVFFFNKDKEIIFQKRGKNKDTFPNLLDATVGGHVELGDNFEQTAIKEVREETGIDLKSSDLILITKLHKRAEDKVTGKINNVIRAIYVYKFNGDLNNLKVEGDLAQGFEKFSIILLVGGLKEEQKVKFVPTLLDNDYLEIYKQIEKII